ncbi:MAG: hypothetical protein ACOC22_02790 [bacterium]
MYNIDNSFIEFEEANESIDMKTYRGAIKCGIEHGVRYGIRKMVNDYNNGKYDHFNNNIDDFMEFINDKLECDCTNDGLNDFFMFDEEISELERIITTRYTNDKRISFFNFFDVLDFKRSIDGLPCKFKTKKHTNGDEVKYEEYDSEKNPHRYIILFNKMEDKEEEKQIDGIINDKRIKQYGMFRNLKNDKLTERYEKSPRKNKNKLKKEKLEVNIFDEEYNLEEFCRYYEDVKCGVISLSRGADIVKNCLNKLNIPYLIEKKFEKCKNKRMLPFDFYIKDRNTLIEVDGKQHYHMIEYFHKDIEAFKQQQKRDNIKNNFCKNNGYNLIRIHYKQFNDIENILKKELGV